MKKKDKDRIIRMYVDKTCSVLVIAALTEYTQKEVTSTLHEAGVMRKRGGNEFCP